jgi:hypothetical protein
MWPPLLARFSLLMEIFVFFFVPRAALVRAAAAAREFPSEGGAVAVSVAVWAFVEAAGVAAAGWAAVAAAVVVCCAEAG